MLSLLLQPLPIFSSWAKITRKFSALSYTALNLLCSVNNLIEFFHTQLETPYSTATFTGLFLSLAGKRHRSNLCDMHRRPGHGLLDYINNATSVIPGYAKQLSRYLIDERGWTDYNILVIVLLIHTVFAAVVLHIYIRPDETDEQRRIREQRATQSRLEAQAQYQNQAEQLIQSVDNSLARMRRIKEGFEEENQGQDTARTSAQAQAADAQTLRDLQTEVDIQRQLNDRAKGLLEIAQTRGIELPVIRRARDQPPLGFIENQLHSPPPQHALDDYKLLSRAELESCVLLLSGQVYLDHTLIRSILELSPDEPIPGLSTVAHPFPEGNSTDIFQQYLAQLGVDIN